MHIPLITSPIQPGTQRPLLRMQLPNPNPNDTKITGQNISQIGNPTTRNTSDTQPNQFPCQSGESTGG